MDWEVIITFFFSSFLSLFPTFFLSLSNWRKGGNAYAQEHANETHVFAIEVWKQQKEWMKQKKEMN